MCVYMRNETLALLKIDKSPFYLTLRSNPLKPSFTTKCTKVRA